MTVPASLADGCLYRTVVRHQRHAPRRHQLSYGLRYLAVDIDALPALDRRLRLFGYNRRALFSLHDDDFGVGPAADRGSLRERMDTLCAEAGLESHGRRYRLLTLPRIFGYAFNPISVVYTWDEHGQPDAVIYEVHNTFRERHAYVLPTRFDEEGKASHGTNKAFYVSPFFSVRGQYDFRTHLPEERMALTISYRDTPERGGDLLLTASMQGTREPLSDGTLLRWLASSPLSAVKVIAAIHFEALRLLWKRIPLTLSEKTPRRRGNASR